MVPQHAALVSVISSLSVLMYRCHMLLPVCTTLKWLILKVKISYNAKLRQCQFRSLNPPQYLKLRGLAMFAPPDHWLDSHNNAINLGRLNKTPFLLCHNVLCHNIVNPFQSLRVRFYRNRAGLIGDALRHGRY